MIRRLKLGAFVRRFVYMLGGEVLQSVFHFALNLAMVRLLSQADYGVFAIIFLVGGIGLTFVRAAAGVPASIFIPKTHSERAARAYAVTFGSGAFVFNAGLGLGVSLLLLSWSAAGGIFAGAFVGLWGFRSYVRNMLFARRMTGIASLSDFAFTTSGACGLALLLWRGDANSLHDAFLVLAVANGIGVSLAFLALREPIRIDLSRHFVRRYRRIWRSLAWSIAGVATANLQAQGQTLLVALIAGPAAYAPMAATLVIFGPLRLPGQALLNLLQPEIAAGLARGQSARVRHLLLFGTLVLGGGTFVYGLLCALGLGLIETHLFVGRFSGEPMRFIGLVTWAIVGVSLLYVPPKAMLETVGAFRNLALCSLVSALVGLPLVAVLLWTLPPAFSLFGLLASEVVVLAGYWGLCVRFTRPRDAIARERAFDAWTGAATAPGGGLE